MGSPIKPGDKPSPAEKRTQLARIVHSGHVKKHPKLVELLSYLIESDIAGAAITQERIGIDVYGRQPDWIPLSDSCVRDGKSRLLKVLEAYYADEGLEDPLNIEIEAYHAVVSRNPRNPVERQLRMAYRYIRTDARLALVHLDSVLAVEPNHAEARACRAETEFWRIFYGYDLKLPGYLDPIREQAKDALQSDAHSWRAHLTLAALHFCERKWKRGAAELELALECSDTRTRAHPWYAAYLMMLGRADEALQVARSQATEGTSQSFGDFQHALFLYAAHQNEAARYVLNRTTIETAHQRLLDVLSYFVLLAKEGFPSKYDRLLLGARTELRQETDDLMYPVLTQICYLNALDPELPQAKLIGDGLKELLRSKLTQRERPMEGEEQRPSGLPFLSPFQLALGYVALGDNERALDLLERDFDSFHPFMLWLHLWPALDPLRTYPRFRALQRRLNLPKP
jgi:hypothetical protein